MINKKWLLLSAVLLLAVATKAQDVALRNNLEDTFFQSGKIKVVIAVAAIILLGLLVYVFTIDRKVSRIEKRLKEK